MKNFMCFAFIAALIAVVCAHPAADAAADAKSAASAASSNATSDAAAASGAAAKAGDAAKKIDPKDAIAAISKDAKGLNPLAFAAQITKFMATISEACQKFIQGILGGSGAGLPGPLPAGIPGVDEVEKLTKIFNPLDAKDIFGNIFKGFGGAEKKDAAAGGASAADAAKKDATAAIAGAKGDAVAKAAEDKSAAAIKEATGAKGVVGALEDAGSKAISGLLGGFGL